MAALSWSWNLIEGHDLFRHVQEHGPLPLEKAVDYILQAAKGLEYAHSKGNTRNLNEG